MSYTILQNPYTAILRAIWGIIKEVAQVAGNNLGKVKLKTEHNYEYNTNGGAGNPLGLLLHPNKWGCGVTEPIKILKSIYGYSSHVDNGSGEPLCGKFKNKKWKSELGRATCMFCERAAIDCSDIEKAEAWLHKKFASCRRHSEWFDLNDSDVQWIMSLTSLEGVGDA